MTGTHAGARSLGERGTEAVGLMLTAMAGWVDAVGYLQLGGVFPSFMSGNTTQLGIALVGAGAQPILLSALMILLFVAGAIAASLCVHANAPWRHAALFGVEAGLLLIAYLVSAFGTAAVWIALAPLPFAMGMQNVIANSWTGAHGGSTFVTGSLVRCGEAIGRALRGARDANWLMPGLAWFVMGVGAVAGAATELAVGPVALVVPAAFSVLAAAVALRTTPAPGPRAP